MVLIVPISVGIGIGIGLPQLDAIVGQIVASVIAQTAGFSVFLALQSHFLVTRGQTIGKIVAKTQILDRTTGQIPVFWPMIMKRYAWIWAVQVVPVIGGLISIVDVLMIFRQNRACLHDDTANTMVVKKRVYAS